MTAPALREGVSLRPFNTLGLDARARYFAALGQSRELPGLLARADDLGLPALILGGGSNLLFAGDVDAVVIRMAIRGRRWEQVEDDTAILALGAGEPWHEAVLYAAGAGYRGIENLALIPGTAGAAPVQNIGAYGVELRDTLVSVSAWDTALGAECHLSAEECRFGYRDSVFKHEPGRYIITGIRLRLSRSRPFSLDYGDLRHCLEQRLGSSDGGGRLTPRAVAETVMAIRRDKLPDPSTLPNAGSFFKNPVVDRAVFEGLKARYPDMPSYDQGEGVKLAAGWLIDQCGWKGHRDARVGVHSRQALVLINHAGGSGADLLDLARRIRASVEERFGVALEMEPGVVGGSEPPTR